MNYKSHYKSIKIHYKSHCKNRNISIIGISWESYQNNIDDDVDELYEDQFKAASDDHDTFRSTNDNTGLYPVHTPR